MIRDTKTITSFTFTDLAELREWLNRFETTDLNKVTVSGRRGGRSITVRWIEDQLSDNTVEIEARFE